MTQAQKSLISASDSAGAASGRAGATAGAASKPAAKAARRPRAVAGPDFICIGLQKAGTQWLYDQLQTHEDFWMPPYKEIHYFDRRFPDGKIGGAARKFLANADAVRRKRDRRGDAPIDERGADFYEQIAKFEGARGDLEAYAQLFRAKGDKISGDVTPAYCSIDPKVIHDIAERFDELKVCMMLREPVSRLWSQWRMHNANNGLPLKAEKKAKKFKKFVNEPEVLRRSYPSEIARSWRDAFGDRFRFFFLDDVIARPDETRAEIVAFLGGDPAKASSVEPGFNRKAKARPIERNKKVQRMMREFFEEERVRCAEMFGGPAEKWPDLPY